MPGAKFKRQAAVWHQHVMDMTHVPFAAVKRGVAEGSAAPSVVSALLRQFDDSEDKTRIEGVIRDMAATAYAGGADTSVSLTGTFISAILLHPDVQRKAHAELDRVLGQDRLPTLEDQPKLPYVTAILREGMRWRPVVPLAVPHALLKDDEYFGYHLPAGAIVIGNAWAILHDEARYPDPDIFNPDRFIALDGGLDLNVPNPEEFAFGFGRRICPGRHLASNSAWLALASILAVFELELPIDEFGREIKPSGEYTPGLIVYPLPFKCKFKPRSVKAEALIRASAAETEL
ncbi:hypothetical protein EIP86_000908 [Pleurotus ostreatoroseus]|nr:hypothetical protein EIP86_000908 [Pleurotus ostreatoroseus]